MNDLDVAFFYLLGDEGMKYVNDPNDMGGPTKFGITKRTYERHFGEGATDEDIANMKPLTAKLIYNEDYWEKMWCDRMTNLPISIAIFDTGVLYAPEHSVRLSQISLSYCGAPISADGVMGRDTITHLNQIKASDFIVAFHSRILNRIDELIKEWPSDEEYRNGWTNRADRLLSLLDENTIDRLKQSATKYL